MRLLLRDVELHGARVDVTVVDGLVDDVGLVDRSAAPDEIVEGGGGALLPGLWDHHVHLLAAAAARTSVAVGPEEVGDAAGLESALRAPATTLAPGAWLRAVGYHESVAGELDRHRLDAVVADRPLRVQHRSGAAWILNSEACRLVGLDGAAPAGVERDEAGRPTGRVFGADEWLRSRVPADDPVLEPIGADASRFGIVGFTDATPSSDLGGWELVRAARRSGALPQRVVVTGGPDLAGATPPEGLGIGPVKVYLADHRLPGLDEVVDAVRAARSVGRPVAFHVVTRAALVLTIAALRVAGDGVGDRIEHGAVIPPELDADLLELGLTVVTQPAFVTERGDSYRRDVAAEDRPHLYRCASLLAAGVRVATSSDAPHATLDPWATMRAATGRRTPARVVLGADERVPAATALRLSLGHPDDPGGPPRRVDVGAPADLCVLDRPLADALHRPSADHVAATVVGGRVVYRRGGENVTRWSRGV